MRVFVLVVKCHAKVLPSLHYASCQSYAILELQLPSTSSLSVFYNVLETENGQ